MRLIELQSTLAEVASGLAIINNTFNDRQPKYKHVLDPDKMDELKQITLIESKQIEEAWRRF